MRRKIIISLVVVISLTLVLDPLFAAIRYGIRWKQLIYYRYKMKLYVPHDMTLVETSHAGFQKLEGSSSTGIEIVAYVFNKRYQRKHLDRFVMEILNLNPHSCLLFDKDEARKLYYRSFNTETTRCGEPYMFLIITAAHMWRDFSYVFYIAAPKDSFDEELGKGFEFWHNKVYGLF